MKNIKIEVSTLHIHRTKNSKRCFLHIYPNSFKRKRVAEVKGERHSELKIVGIDQTQHISDVAHIISFIPNTDMTISKYLEKYGRYMLIFLPET